MKLLYNPCTFDFFKHPERVGEIGNLEDAISEAFNEVYREEDWCRKKQIKFYRDKNDHPLVLVLRDYFNSPRQLDPENAKCDEAFSEYLFKVSRNANQSLFTKILKFVFLFRESLNYSYKDKVGHGEDKDYSELFNAEDAPDNSNEFVTEFMEADPTMFNFTKEEVIDLTQNMCQWLYDNNFTCSKLSMINPI